MVLMKVVRRAQFTASRQPSVVTFLKRESLIKDSRAAFLPEGYKTRTKGWTNKVKQNRKNRRQ
jgi:hypothetical protein